MKKTTDGPLLALLATSLLVLSGCTGATPGYCEATADCDPGQYCNTGKNACEPRQDSAVLEASADSQGDTGQTDAPLWDSVKADALPDTLTPDTVPPDTVKPDTGKPPVCSDDVKNQSFEVCDGKDLNGGTCVKQGFDGGTLKCAPDCKSYITTGCYKCSDKKKNGTEECDGTDFGTATCKTKGFECGALACTSQCKISTAGCRSGWATKLPAGVDALAVDSAGNVYVTGIFTAPATFGTKVLKGSNLFIAKLDPAGKFLWAVAATGFVKSVNSIAVDAAGSAYIVGEYDTTVTFGLYPLTFQGSCGIEGYVVKLDKNGAFKWATYIGGASSWCEKVTSVVVDKSGNLLVGGGFEKTTKFGTITKTALGSIVYLDVFVAKMNAATGAFSWVSVGGGDEPDVITDLAVDSVGSVYATGYFSLNAALGNKNLSSTYSYQAFASKLNSSGVFLWATPMPGTFMAGPTANIAVDASGNSYVTTSITGTPKYGATNIVNKGGSDVLVAKMNVNGQIMLGLTAGGAGADTGWEIESGGGGVVYAIGGFASAAAFGTTPISGSTNNPFLARINASSFTSALAGTWSPILNPSGWWMYGSLAVDPKGNPYVGGDFSGTKKFGPTTLSGGSGFVWNPVCTFP